MLSGNTKQSAIAVAALAATMAFLYTLFGGRQPLLTIPSLSEQELSSQVKGKNFLVLGGTKGIGAALASSLVERGANVIVVGRSKTEETPSKAEFIKSDVSLVANSQELVRKQLKGKTFDTVVMTVGIITRPQLTKTSEGIEEDLAISYFSRFVVLNELIRAGQLQGRKRVFIMGYPGEKIEPVSIDDINFDTTPYKQWGAHMNTVVFNEGLVYSLARRYPDLHVFGLNPGLIQTGVRDNVHGGDATIFGKVVEKVISWTNPSPKQYAETGLMPLMATPLLDSNTAISFSRKLVDLPPGPWIAQEANQEKAWKVSQELVSKAVPDSPIY